MSEPNYIDTLNYVIAKQKRRIIELEDKMKMIQHCSNCPVCKKYAKEVLQIKDTP